MVTETGSGMDSKRRKLNRTLADPTVGTIVVEHSDRLARMNAGLVESALTAQGQRLIGVDVSELDVAPVRYLTQAVASFSPRLSLRPPVRDQARPRLPRRLVC
ncbi:UNVERIFIED_CONTAM: IS607 family transposase, partial [Bifidobacterium longum subsp. infantis]|nr:IS607 family transposase [Bifidobacterium longum subsp. infantis]